MSTATQVRPSTTTQTRERLEARVNDLVSYVRDGRIIEAMHEFYADDAIMQENNNPPTAGLSANVERERQFLAAVKTWLGFEVGTIAVDAQRGKTTVQSTLSFEGVDGKTNRIDQVAVQTWRDGKIAHEKFYYDTGAGK